MKKTTKLFASFLVLGALFALSISLASALGHPYEFRMGTTPVLVGEFFELDGTQFAEASGNLYVYFSSEWYLVEAGTYVLTTSPWTETVQVLEDHDCGFDGYIYFCAGEGSGSGGGM